MAKAKARQPSKPNAPNPHIYARINFLYQSAQLLSYSQVSDTTTTTPHPPPSSPGTGPSSANTSLSRFYLSNARAVAKKSVLRIAPAVKRTICKRCDALLIPGATSTHSIVNDSHNGRKPWADVLVVECKGCGAVKRFPVGMETKKKKDWKLWSERPDIVIGGEAKNNRGDQEKQQMEIDTTEGLVPHKAEEPDSKDTVDVTEDVARIHDHGTAA
jgi:ribonuclease P protein subunit RPR2